MRDPPFNYVGRYDATGEFIPADLTKFSNLWDLATGRAFSQQIMAYSLPEYLRELIEFGIQLWGAFFAIGTIPAIVGAAVLLYRKTDIGLALLLMFVYSAGFFVGYRTADKVTMYLPAYVIWAVWLGAGYQWLLDWPLGPTTSAVRTRTAQYSKLLAAVMCVAVAASFYWSWPRVDLSNDWTSRQRGERVLEILEPNSILIGWWGTVPVVEYLQLVEHQRSDVKTINRFLIAVPDLKKLILSEIGSRPIYLDHPPSSFGMDLAYVSEDFLFRLLPRSRIVSRHERVAEVVIADAP